MTSLTCAIFVILGLPQQAMTDGPSPAELAAMKKLSFLVGKWEGEATFQQGPTRLIAKGSETVQWKLQGKALLVEGLFTEVDSKKVVHETLAVITYDEKASKYRFTTFLVNRPNGEYELRVLDNGFSWVMKPTQQVDVTFSMNLIDGQWSEIGEYSFNGGPKTKFLEMKLKKLK